MNGYTKGARNELFALRPAPIQVKKLIVIAPSVYWLCFSPFFFCFWSVCLASRADAHDVRKVVLEMYRDKILSVEHSTHRYMYVEKCNS